MDRIHTSQANSIPGPGVLNAIHESNLTHADSKIKSGIEKSVKKKRRGQCETVSAGVYLSGHPQI